MPSDSKRNQGPDDSEDYHIFEAVNQLDIDIKSIKGGNRLDGRSEDEQRKIYLKTGVNSRVKGSSYIEVGRTKVIVSVYEPKEIPRLAEFCANGELYCEFRIAPFARKIRRNLIMQSDEKDLSLQLKRALEPAVCRGEFPNCQVDVYACVLDDDGGSFSAAVTAAGVALADAGIPMFDTIGSATVGYRGTQRLMDPTLLEEELCSACSDGEESGLFTVVYLASLGQISSVILSGGLAMERVLENMNFVIDRCCNVADLSRLVLTKDIMKKSQDESEDSSCSQ